MGIHLLHSTHGGEKIASHDAIQDVFAPIAKDAHFHVLWEQTRIFSLFFFVSSHQRVDIVLSFDGIRTLADVIIVDPT
jgi:exonuclease I